METSEFLTTVDRIHTDAHNRGLYFQVAGDQPIRDRRIRLGGRNVVSFASCSYLGLEHHPDLVAGVVDAVRTYGTQFSTSRGYVSAPAYGELEPMLDRIFDGHTLVTSSTTLGHQSSLPVLVTERDAIVLDHQVHHSVQVAARIAQAGGAQVRVVKHGQLDRAAEVVAELARTRERVWFAVDGVFSMYGDLAPLGLLKEVLGVADNVWLYVDDAHGMSWAGRHGCGSFLSRMPMHQRLVLATSLNKAFSAGGGCLVFPTRDLRNEVVRCGGAHVFSGPVQPPMLGAAVASARLHLSKEIQTWQALLRDRVATCHAAIEALQLPLLVKNDSPIFFMRTGLPRVAFTVAQRMLEDGWYVTPSAYPSVPLDKAGLRFTVTARHDPEEITAALASLAVHLEAALAAEGIGRSALDEAFARALPQQDGVGLLPWVGDACPQKAPGVTALGPRTCTLEVEHHATIDALDAAEWDGLLGTVGSCSHAALRLAEQVFADAELPEHCWNFDYLVVRDTDGHPVAASFFTTMLNKDDMLMRDEVSQAVEQRRVDDPYFLTSRIMTMGSGFSEGNHLYLDRTGPWQDALALLLESVTKLYDEREASMLLLRDLPTADAALDQFVHENGFVRVPMFDSHHLSLDWADEETWLESLSRRKRKHIKGIIAQSAAVRRTVYSAASGRSPSPKLCDLLHEMYLEVANRKRKLNVFPLPRKLVSALAGSQAWELVTVHLSADAGGPADERPVAWYAAHIHKGHYAPFLCGLDYDYVWTRGAYRAMIYQVVQRARELGIGEIHMGMDADLEKERFGTHRQANSVYLRVGDHFNGRLLQDIVAEVGLERSAS